MRNVGVVGLAAFAVAMGAFPGFAAAAGLECGDTITRSVVLRADLKDCAINGLVIGADGVEVDLNGHVIAGNGRHDGPEEVADVGVLSAGFDHVTITNGTIRNFDVNAQVVQAEGARVLDLTFASAGAVSLAVVDSTGARVSGNRASGASADVVLNGSDHTVVTHNHSAGAGVFGIGDFGGESNRIARNIITGSLDGGIRVGNGSRRGVIDRNLIFDGDFAAIVLDGGSENLVLRNRVLRNQAGLIVIGDDNRVTHNTLTDIVGCGDVGCSIGISAEGGSRNVFDHNTVTRTDLAGIRLDAFVGETADNVFRANHVRNAGTDAFAIGAEDVGPIERTRLERNTAIRSGDDGFDIRVASTTLTRNLALRNGDFGFEAVAGVADGGGNHAALNGNPLQCTNLACQAP